MIEDSYGNYELRAVGVTTILPRVYIDREGWNDSASSTGGNVKGGTLYHKADGSGSSDKKLPGTTILRVATSKTSTGSSSDRKIPTTNHPRGNSTSSTVEVAKPANTVEATKKKVRRVRKKIPTEYVDPTDKVALTKIRLRDRARYHFIRPKKPYLSAADKRKLRASGIPCDTSTEYSLPSIATQESNQWEV